MPCHTLLFNPPWKCSYAFVRLYTKVKHKCHPCMLFTLLRCIYLKIQVHHWYKFVASANFSCSSIDKWHQRNSWRVWPIHDRPSWFCGSLCQKLVCTKSHYTIWFSRKAIEGLSSFALFPRGLFNAYLYWWGSIALVVKSLFSYLWSLVDREGGSFILISRWTEIFKHQLLYTLLVVKGSDYYLCSRTNWI